MKDGSDRISNNLVNLMFGTYNLSILEFCNNKYFISSNSILKIKKNVFARDNGVTLASVPMGVVPVQYVTNTLLRISTL